MAKRPKEDEDILWKFRVTIVLVNGYITLVTNSHAYRHMERGVNPLPGTQANRYLDAAIVLHVYCTYTVGVGISSLRRT